MITEKEMFLRLIIASILGGLIGLEREIHGRAAGLRTHILVCLGSTLIMLTSIYIYEVYRGVTQVDPARIAAGVVTGIGFLGAGTILRFRASVRGLTTAASLWTVAGIGLAMGVGFYPAAYLTTILALITLVLLSRLEKFWLKKDYYKTIEIETKVEAKQMEAIRKLLRDYEIDVKDFDLEQSPENREKLRLKLSLKLLTNKYDDEILDQMMNIEGIYKAKWVEKGGINNGFTKEE